MPEPTAIDETWPFHEALTPEREAAMREIAPQVPMLSSFGIRIDALETDFARIVMPFDARFAQGFGLLHGGAHATLIDSAIAQAIFTTIRTEYSFVTVHLDTKYFKGTSSGNLVAEGKIRRKGRSIVHGDVVVTDDDGKELAQGWTVYAIQRMPEGWKNPRL